MGIKISNVLPAHCPPSWVCTESNAGLYQVGTRVILRRAASASTNLSQRTLASLHITYEHKPGRKGSLFSFPPRWAGAGNSLHLKPLPFLLLHTLNDASEAGWRGSNGHPSRLKTGYFQHTATGSDLPSANGSFWSYSPPQTGVSGGAS